MDPLKAPVAVGLALLLVVGLAQADEPADEPAVEATDERRMIRGEGSLPGVLEEDWVPVSDWVSGTPYAMWSISPHGLAVAAVVQDFTGGLLRSGAKALLVQGSPGTRGQWGTCQVVHPSLRGLHNPLWGNPMAAAEEAELCLLWSGTALPNGHMLVRVTAGSAIEAWFSPDDISATNRDYVPRPPVRLNLLEPHAAFLAAASTSLGCVDRGARADTSLPTSVCAQVNQLISRVRPEVAWLE